MINSAFRTFATVCFVATIALSAPRLRRSWEFVGLIGFGIGAVVGSALTPQTFYAAPPAPPGHYGPAFYGPAPWSSAWYSYCRNLHGPYFNPHTGYFQGKMAAGTSASSFARAQLAERTPPY